jgi:sialate O-acetylesterase
MNLLNGLAAGQVLQRVGIRGANLSLEVNVSEKGAVFATIATGKPLPGWRRRQVGKSSGGRVMLKLEGIPAGGPYRLQLECGKDKFRSGPFYVGDVWVMAGQSNMQGIGDMSGAARPHPLVRAFSMRRVWRLAEDPLHILGESPDECHNGGNQLNVEQAERERRLAVKGVGVGLFFGSEMLSRARVPQGLICAAHGGTSMTQWNPALKNEGGNSQYGSMLLSVRATGQPVAGILWYQGESDASKEQAPLYTERMRALVAASRRDLKQKGLPWIVVQISRVYGGANDAVSWNSIQDQERLLPDKIKNLETISGIDLAMDDSIHIGAAGYPRLASRMARAAARLVYGNRKEQRPPQFKSVQPNAPGKGVAANTFLEVTFDHVIGGLRAQGEPQGFTLLDADGKVWPQIYKTTLHGAMVRLHLGWPIMPGVKLFYGHGTMPICNIVDARGESLPVFGPVEIMKPRAHAPFLTRWKRTEVIASSTSIEKLKCPDPDAFGATVKAYGPENPFIDEHQKWIGKSGHVYYAAGLDLPEPMKLQFLMGYDGPFRVWLDGKPFFQDLNGINPARIDESQKTVNLTAGAHRINVAMDINHGQAWGFFFRFARADINLAKIRAKDYAVPGYTA